MTDRELLFERYADATFALMMDELVREESERLYALNKTLSEDSDYDLPEDARSRCLRRMEEAFRARRRAQSRRRSAKLLRILPIAVVIALALFTIAFAASPALQDKVFHLFRSESETNVTLDLRSDEQMPPELPMEEGSFVVQVPEGFTLVDSTEQEQFFSQTYCSDDGASFSFDAMRGSSVSFSRDQEHLTLQKRFELHGEQVELLADESGNYAAVTSISDLNYPFLVFATSKNIDEDTFVQILSTLEFQKRDG